MKKTTNYLNRDFKKQRSNDSLTEKARSTLMSKIKSKNTKFERDFIASLSKATRKEFQTHVATLRGKPDIVFPNDKICIFLDSDFWHGWYYPRWKHLLKNDFWRQKIEANRRRDKRNNLYLRRSGWTVLRFWEHKIKAKRGTIIESILAHL